MDGMNKACDKSGQVNIGRYPGGCVDKAMTLNERISPEDSEFERGHGKPLRIGVGIATCGRPQVLSKTLTALKQQTRLPDAIGVCAPSRLDTGDLSREHSVRILIGPNGLCHQRNAILEALIDLDIIIFFDDDFVPEAQYVEKIETLFRTDNAIVMATGSLLADGILGPGITFNQAMETLESSRSFSSHAGLNCARKVEDIYNCYGCNMAIRLQPVRTHNVRFDEALPRYSWLEDVDFSRQLAAHGRIVKAMGTYGVHLGVKSGRIPGHNLGYSQIANPVYLSRKKTLAWHRALYIMAHNLTSNTFKSIWPEAYIDRRGRLLGNIRGIIDLLMGRLHPQKVLKT